MSRPAPSWLLRFACAASLAASPLLPAAAVAQYPSTGIPPAVVPTPPASYRAASSDRTAGAEASTGAVPPLPSAASPGVLPANDRYPSTETPGVRFAPTAPGPARFDPPPSPQARGGNAIASAAVRASAEQQTLSRAQPIEGGQIIARVGKEVVLADEVLPAVNELLARNADKIPPQQVAEARRMLMQQHLKGLIETKLLFNDARGSIPADNLPKIRERVAERFEEYQLPKLLEGFKVETRSELEARLKKAGSSLAQQRRMFVERTIGSQWMRQQVDFDREITHEQMLAYYRERQADYEVEAQARWEELMVRHDRFSSKDEAYAALAALGNRVFAGKVPLADVARAESHGVTAATGGGHDWTTRGSLVATDVDRALFTLPVGQLSPIVEGPHGFHIVRVLERRDAGRRSFSETQQEIRKTIGQEDVQKQVRAYVEKLRAETPVWTAFDDAPAEPPAVRLGSR